MESINEIVKDKNFSQEAIYYLENAINEFDDLFGKYVSKEDLLSRIKNNIDAIEFVDEINTDSPCISGRYIPAKKKIEVKNGYSVENTKSIFFHELLHSIVVDKSLRSGFINSYISSFYNDTTLFYGMGWNEGFVQMLTEIRDLKYSKGERFRSYPILTETVKIFTELFGKDELIDMHFNRAGEFHVFLDKRNISPNFLVNFDIIHKHEKEIYMRRSSFNELFTILLGGNPFDPEASSAYLNIVQDEIIHTYIDELLKGNVSDLLDLFDKVKHIYQVFQKKVGVEALDKILLAVTPELISQKQSIESKDEILLHSAIRYEEYKKLNTKEKLNDINNFFSFLTDYIIDLYKDQSLMDEYCSKSVEELFEGIPDYSKIDLFLFLMAFRGVSQYILNNNLPFEDLKFEFNTYDYGNVYEIYKLQEDGEYAKLTTLMQYGDEDFDVIECTPVSDEQKRELIHKYNLGNFGNVTNIVTDCNGNFIVKGLTPYYLPFSAFINEKDGYVDVPITSTITLPCINELKKMRQEAIEKYKDYPTTDLTFEIVRTDTKIQNRSSAFKSLSKQGAPPIILQNEAKLINMAKKELFALKLVIKARRHEEKVAVAQSNKPVYTPQDIKTLLIQHGLIPASIDQIEVIRNEENHSESVESILDDFNKMLAADEEFIDKHD